MASNYKFSNEEMAAIKAARRETKDKRADARLKALELRAEGMELSEVSQATGFHAAYVSQLVAKYRDHGLEAISGNHYGGNHRNMSFEEEAAILAPFKARAEKGELVEISEIETAYQQAVGHSIGTSQIYYVLHRHGWRKVMPRSSCFACFISMLRLLSACPLPEPAFPPTAANRYRHTGTAAWRKSPGTRAAHLEPRRSRR